MLISHYLRMIFNLMRKFWKKTVRLVINIKQFHTLFQLSSTDHNTFKIIVIFHINWLELNSLPGGNGLFAAYFWAPPLLTTMGTKIENWIFVWHHTASVYTCYGQGNYEQSYQTNGQLGLCSNILESKTEILKWKLEAKDLWVTVWITLVYDVFSSKIKGWYDALFDISDFSSLF